MSTLFSNWLGRACGANGPGRACGTFALALAMLTLAGCSSTATAPSSGAVDPVAEARADEAVTEASGNRDDRRSRRRSRRADPEPASDGQIVEVPAPAAQSYARAVDAMAVGNWLEAELELEQLVLEYTDFPGPYANLAIVYMNDGRDEDARAALDNALALAPAHPAANNQLGILLRRQGDFAGAEAAYRTAIEADPGYLLAHHNLGVLLDLYLRRQSEALEHYERYQDALGEPDAQVARWIIDLRRRLDVADRAERLASEDGS